jgi:hypothetical protein
VQRSDTLASRSHQSVKNPVAIAREALGYNQELFAAVAEVSRIAVMHTEQGLITSVPERIYKTLGSPPGLRDHYQYWIRDTRIKNYVYLEKGIDLFLNPRCSGYGNWGEFRDRISRSRIGFCKLYCIHPQILSTFEKNWEERSQFTVGLRRVLVDAGMGRDTVANMEFAMGRRGAYSG